MEATKTIKERLSWRTKRSCGCEYDVLTLDHREVADLMEVPAGWATRNYMLEFEVKGAHQVLPTRQEAMRVAEAWFRAGHRAVGIAAEKSTKDSHIRWVASATDL